MIKDIQKKQDDRIKNAQITILLRSSASRANFMPALYCQCGWAESYVLVLKSMELKFWGRSMSGKTSKLSTILSLCNKGDYYSNSKQNKTKQTPPPKLVHIQIEPTITFMQLLKFTLNFHNKRGNRFKEARRLSQCH
jgi:hypothetical protein